MQDIFHEAKSESSKLDNKCKAKIFHILFPSNVSFTVLLRKRLSPDSKSVCNAFFLAHLPRVVIPWIQNNKLLTANNVWNCQKIHNVEKESFSFRNLFSSPCSTVTGFWVEQYVILLSMGWLKSIWGGAILFIGFIKHLFSSSKVTFTVEQAKWDWRYDIEICNANHSKTFKHHSDES